MRNRLSPIAGVVMPLSLLPTGCTHMLSSSAHRIHPDAVSVRFVMAPDAGMDDESAMSLASDEWQWNAPPAGTCQVTLWGGRFDGTDVTHAAVPLESGAYSFQFADPQSDTFCEGVLNVNPTDDLLDVMSAWRGQLAAEKKWLDHEAKMYGGFADAAEYNRFQRKIYSFERLDRRLDALIQAEQRDESHAPGSMARALNFKDLLLLPTGPRGYYTTTTRPAVSTADLASLHEDAPLTKIVIAVDHRRVVSKLRRLAALSRELMHCRAAFAEDIEHVQRSKRLFTLTARLDDQGRPFMRSDRGQRSALAQIDKLNTYITACRDRTLALAFAAELIAPGGRLEYVDEVVSHLGRQRRMLETKELRLDEMLASASDQSPRKMILQRRQQQVAASMMMLQDRIARVDHVRAAMVSLAESTEVIHRQGSAVVATMMMDETVPTCLADAMLHESLMTIHLSAADQTMFPTMTTMNDAPFPQAYSDNVSWLADAPEANVSFADQPEFDQQSVDFDEPCEEERDFFTIDGFIDPVEAMQDAGRDGTNAKGQGHGTPSDDYVVRANRSLPVSAADRAGRPHMSARIAGSDSQQDQAVMQDNAPWDQPSAAESDQSKKNKKDRDCPLLIRILVPPCWFAE